MEIGQQSDTQVAPATETSAPSASVQPSPFVASDNNTLTPMHTQTQSTLAPTSEYVRYLLLALPARYIPRGIVGTLFETNHYNPNGFLAKLANWFQKKVKVSGKNQAELNAALAYNAIMGVGSLALTASYSRTVYSDIKNIFSEAVAMETGKAPGDVTSNDLQRSDNRIVQKTMENFKWRTAKRLVTDLLFFPAAAVRSEKLGDLMVGGKALQAFGETWKRKTTMFEDLVTFINNKINPRNGLGQQIGVGEVFDLYQHYTEAFNPEKMFTNVLERGTGEGARWAQNQPIFERLTELMNLTYAYKHSTKIDPKTGHAIHQADFALPKFIYLLGHDLIDVNKPAQTLATIEIANQFGIGAVKEMQTMLKSGATLEQVAQRFPLPEPQHMEKTKPENGKKNAVIAKGSTMQLDQPEGEKIPLNLIQPESATLQQTLAANDPTLAVRA